MTEPSKPDDPAVIAGKYAQVAKHTVTSAAKVATDAFDKINADRNEHPRPEPYGSRDAINTIAQLFNVALTGTISLARVSLQTRADQGVLIVADNVASIVNRGLSDAIGVLAEVADQTNTAMGTTPVAYNSDNLVDAAIKLTNISALRGAEIIETVVAGPGPYANPVVKRRLPIDPKDYKRFLEIDSLKLKGHSTDIKLLVSFDPPGGELPAKSDHYTIVVSTAGLPSGVYSGHVLGRRAIRNDGDRHGPKVPDMLRDPTRDAILVALPETGDPGEP